MFQSKIILSVFFIVLIYKNHVDAQTTGAGFCGPYTLSQPVLINAINDTTISLLEISNPSGHCIKITNCNNIIIEKCLLGPSSGNGIDLYNCRNVEIRDCRIDSVSSGVFALASQIINVHNIEVKNVQGPFPRGQMVQFDKVDSIGNRVNFNIVENILGESYAEDAINMYKSNGTPSDPIQIKGNWIRGGGPSASGGGIMTGDSGGSNVKVEDNILVNPGQYGIAIASGTDIEILNNKVYSKQLSFSNVGIYVWNQYPDSCGGNRVNGNEVNWTNNLGLSNDRWNGGGCGTITDWNNNTWGAAIDSSILPLQILLNCTTTANLQFFEEENSIKIFPNPFKRKIFIENYSAGRFILYDYSGRIVKNILTNPGNTAIDIQSCKSGLYFYVFRSKQKNEFGKLLKIQ